MDGVNADTVWTWNAIGKRAGAWNLPTDAPEATRGFLLNHLIAELLPEQNGYRYSNSDPVTGQAAWYDLRVRLEKAPAAEAGESAPRFAPIVRPPGLAAPPAILRYGADLAPATASAGATPPGRRAHDRLRRTAAGPEEARPRHRPRHLRRLPRLRGQLQGMEHRRPLGAADRPRPLRRRRRAACGSTASTPTRSATARSGRTVHFPRTCLHCDEPACVTVCPTGASYKRAEDGIVLVNADTCIGCKLCSWACPYGAREFDEDAGVMKKCTLCIDRIYNENLGRRSACRPACSTCPASARHFGDLGDPDSDVSQLVATRGGDDLMPELGYKPVNHYLPPRRSRHAPAAPTALAPVAADGRRCTRCCAGSTACCRARPPTMHPALSVIVFTTASGAGYGLLALLRRAGAGRLAAGRDPWFGAAALGAALLLVTAGLLSSTAHLGHPERAWRALSQWRTSWLSREGVAALATYVPAGLFGLGWVLPRPHRRRLRPVRPARRGTGRRSRSTAPR